MKVFGVTGVALTESTFTAAIKTKTEKEIWRTCYGYLWESNQLDCLIP